MGNISLRVAPVRATLAGLALTVLPMASFAFVSVGVSITVAPPALPVYEQPPCPAVGYIWTPGYWAYEDGDYYWVPGTWVMPPTVGLLWTPGYWGWSSGVYLWHAGYWGPHVGFYGGVNYGYGYGGVGFEGGYWRGGAFYYNRSVANLGGIHVTNVYNRTVVNNITVNRVSFNGGEGGLRARPSSRELAAEHEHHIDFTPVQREHEHMAFGNHDLRASVNGGRPRIAATERPGVFAGHGIVGAREAGAPYHPGGDHGPGGAHGPGPRNEPVHMTTRNDRPSSRVPEAHSAEPAMGRNDRPMPHEQNFSRPQNPTHIQEGPRSQQFAQRAPQAAPRLQEGPRMQGAPGMQGGPRVQSSPHVQEGPRPQSTPRPENVPHQQNMARPDVHRGGGSGEPRGQNQPHREDAGPRGDRGRR